MCLTFLMLLFIRKTFLTCRNNLRSVQFKTKRVSESNGPTLGNTKIHTHTVRRGFCGVFFCDRCGQKCSILLRIFSLQNLWRKNEIFWRENYSDWRNRNRKMRPFSCTHVPRTWIDAYFKPAVIFQSCNPFCVRLSRAQKSRDPERTAR